MINKKIILIVTISLTYKNNALDLSNTPLVACNNVKMEALDETIPKIQWKNCYGKYEDATVCYYVKKNANSIDRSLWFKIKQRYQSQIIYEHAMHLVRESGGETEHFNTLKKLWETAQ